MTLEKKIDWKTLQSKATEAMKKSYSPYSKFPVGVAALVSDGRIISGCNVENASYGLTLCAECSLISELIMTGGGRLIAAVCVDKDGNLLSPCGRCRQLLYEHGGDELELLTPDGPKNMTVILPWGFGPKNLDS